MKLLALAACTLGMLTLAGRIWLRRYRQSTWMCRARLRHEGQQERAYQKMLSKALSKSDEPALSVPAFEPLGTTLVNGLESAK